MNNKLLVLLLVSFYRSYVRADDVGANFNSDDGESWELDYGYYPFRSYQTTDLISPQFRTLVDSPVCHDDRYVFFTPRGYSIAAPGPMIVDNDGELIWAKSTGGQAYDLVVQEFKGEPYLTYWVGDDRIRGHGAGDYYMLNSGYQQVYKISALNDLAADLHELVITPQGTALITIYQVYPHDLSEFRDFEDWEEDPHYIWDSLFQEIDIETNELLFQWRASEHHSINETYRFIGGGGTKEDAFDWYHINSVEKDEFGNYLISSRYTHTLTYIHGITGEVIWVLGGKRNMFKDLSDGSATNFAWQHDARFHSKAEFPELFRADLEAHGQEKDNNGVTSQLVTMFDNSAEDSAHTLEYSRGLLLEITYPSVHVPPPKGDLSNGDLTERDATPIEDEAYSVRLVRSFEHPQGPLSSSQGSMQVIPQGAGQDSKVFLGYGFNALFTEFASDGSLLCDNHFATNYSWGRGDVQSYRAFKFPWVGHPVDPPTAVLSPEGTIFVSWNGATEVKGWILQQSSRYNAPDDMWDEVVRVNKTGFETAIEVDEEDLLRYLRVTAIDGAGVLLGVSREIDMGWVAGLTSAIPQLETTDMAPVKLIMLVCINVTIIFILYELFRRVFAWRQTRKWRERRGIRLLSDAS